jgi:hypothetical protein
MRYSTILVGIALWHGGELSATCPVPPQSVPTNEANALAVSKLGGFFQCDPQDRTNDRSPCNTFASRGLEAIYHVTDFKVAGGGYMSANEIYDNVSLDPHWAKLGTVFDEDNNLCAQALANNSFPVIAVQKGAGHGHIALVLPGAPARSPSWKFLTANSASFFLDQPNTGYINKLLSNAFGEENAKKAVFYYRK